MPPKSSASNNDFIELRCRIDRAFGITRDQGQLWMDSARAGDLRTMKAIATQLILPSVSEIVTSEDFSASTTPQWRLAHYNGQGTSYGFIGSIALHWAAANDNIAMMKLLLESPFCSSINCQNLGGSTPLHSACANGRLAAAQLLLSYGANPNIVDVCQDTPLQVIPSPEVARERTKGRGGQKKADPLADLRQLMLGAGRLDSLILSQPDPSQWILSDLKSIANTFSPYFSDAVPSLVERGDYVTLCQQIVAHWQTLSSASAASASAASSFHMGVQGRHLQRLLEARQEFNARKELKKKSAEGVEGAAPINSDHEEEEAEDLASQRRADVIKAKANTLYQNKDYKGAIKLYTTAIAINPLQAVLYSNRAAAYLGLSSASSALQDCRAAMMLDPSYAKPVYRLGQALLILGRVEECVDLCKDALRGGDGAGPPLKLKLSAQEVEAFKVLLSAAEAEVKAEATSTSDLKESREEPFTFAAKATMPSNPHTMPSYHHKEERGIPPTSNHAYTDPAGRRPWFDCPLCENRTRDKTIASCCGEALCGTCWKRRADSACPYCRSR